MDKVVHFEIPFDDEERAKTFYSTVFGWKLNSIPEMNYTIVHTVAVDDKMMPKESGAINGGMYKRDEQSAPYPVIVINVTNLDEALKQVTDNGGEIFRGKMKVGEMGWYAQVKDTEGNIIGMWETVKVI